MGYTGPVFYTASFWAWAHGPAGYDHAGEAIASSAMVEEAITAEPVRVLTAEVSGAGRQHAARTRHERGLPLQVGRAQRIVPHAARLRGASARQPQHRAPRPKGGGGQNPSGGGAAHGKTAVVKLGWRGASRGGDRIRRAASGRQELTGLPLFI